MRNIKHFKRGFTLVELMVVCFLLALVIGVAGYMVMSGIKAQIFERSVRNAQTTIRLAMDRMADDMRLATNVTSATNHASNNFNFTGGVSTCPSGVIVPSSYGGSERGTDTLTGMRADDQTSNRNQAVNFSVDRTVFTRLRDSSEHLGTTSLSSASSIDNFVYVVWEVPYATPFEVTRKVYRTEGNIGWDGSQMHTFSDERGLNVWAPLWSFSLDKMTSQRGGSLLLNINLDDTTESDNRGDFTVASLISEDMRKSFKNDAIRATHSEGGAGRGGDFIATNATMHFVVSHAAYRGHSGGGGSFNLGDSVEPVYYTKFDRHLYRIDFYALVHKDGDGVYNDVGRNQNTSDSMIAYRFLQGQYKSGDLNRQVPVTQLEISTQVRVSNRD